MEENLFAVLKYFLTKEKIQLNLKELKFQLQSHPSYPSLHALTGVLSHLGIRNMALKVPVNTEVLKELPERFMSVTNDYLFMVVSRVQEGYEVYHDNNTRKHYNPESFLDEWSGVVVATELDETVLKLKEEIKHSGAGFRMAILITTLALLVGSFFISGPNGYQLAHFILAVGGLLISLLILQHELGMGSKALNKICAGNEATSCDAVLNSRGATVFAGLKLSDLSLMFFTGVLFNWIAIAVLGSSAGIVGVLTVLAIPVTLYSLYYQYQVVRKWCPLCLGIVVVLWLQFFSLLLFESFALLGEIRFSDGFISLVTFSIAVSIWLVVRPLLHDQKALMEVQVAHLRFKRNFDLFQSMLEKTTRLRPALPAMGNREIILGNELAPVDILLVTSPQCFYCKAAHRDLTDILMKNSEEIKLTIRFNVNAKNREDVGNQVCSRLLELYETSSDQVFMDALHAAYTEDGELTEWLVRWGEPEAHDAYAPVIEAQKNWCLDHDINFTPALYINGMQYPKQYERPDLNYFIEDITEYVLEKNNSAIQAELVNNI